ncbi:hypothetical protein ABB37_04434 [Leptomonas pyrrhocoris]|uniref:ATP synthase regulation protein NCA2 n=1 Tax=Leptomonas pyrrhocoris TaxID=157538 RepID=A0A0M9G2T1_LEPPY|nr:hypothetical protein ABB37_04434 [Leptomonas pyrrhocoris]XP_015659513.1 hypothetical protein ABB37_04434 [Leptomonas pyrrhocoris]KPA81073.1 hypothetical protein ABB37_04434 [Leptomonas pyrrhocoris]KPA81074.1 hypothetical protein ABB37_04434 [Leptomonas pyrrhocoris]|eukprot:XP_015659512.1 hypothetical protein ABB37_04434 [Leptomonas pyrrhocoris]
MPYYDVDVRTPIFYRQSFASALETQSNKAYARLTHTPVVAEHLPRGAASGARIAQFGTSRLRNLDELEKLLHTVLEEVGPTTCGDGGGATVLHCSTRELGAAAMERTVISPSSLARVRSSHTQTSQKDVESGVPCAPSPASDALFVTEIDGNDNGGGLSRPTAREMPHSVSFLEDACCVPPLVHRDAVSDQHRSESKGIRLWRWVRGWVRRGASPSAPSSSPTVRPREERRMEGGGGVGARSYRREYTTGTAAALACHSSAPQPEKKAPSLPGVPEWVRAAFAPTASAIAAATVDNVHASVVHTPLGSSTHETGAGAAEESLPSTRDGAMPVDGGASGVYSASLRRTTDAFAGHTAGVAATPKDKGGGSGCKGNGQLPAGDTDGTNSASSQPSSLPTAEVLLESWCRRSDSGAVHGSSGDDTARSCAHTEVPADSHFWVASPCGSLAHANASAAEDGDAARSRNDVQRGPTHKSGASTAVTPTIRTETTAGSSEAPPCVESSGERDGDASAPSLPHRGQSAAASHAHNSITTTDEPHRANASFSFTGHNGAWKGGNCPHSTATQHPAASRGTHGTNTLARWDRHAYAVELVGWLHLLVWVRCQVIYFLRDLSGVQGFVAWSAWYWSWAQEHPRQASLHQALSSRRFWRGLWKRGLSAQLSEVQYETSGHMFTLKNAFRLIVSCIGAAYTSLEHLNSVILQVQHHCEMTTPPRAAAAAAARSCVASIGAVGVSMPVIPELNSSINRSAYITNRRDFLSNQNSVFWSPAPVSMMNDDLSPLAPQPRDGVDSRAGAAVDSHNAHRSVFDGACEQDRANGAAMGEAAAEEVEAAAALCVLDELRQAVWSMLKEQRSMFHSSGQQLEALESNDFFGWPGEFMHADGRPLGNASTTHTAGGRVPVFAESLLSASVTGEVYPAGSSPRVYDEARRPAEDRGSGCPVTARDGAVALLQRVQQSRHLVLRLKVFVQRAHNPPAARHWQRIVIAAATTIPPFIWLYRKTPAELMELGRGRYHLAQLIVKSYLLDPIAQLRESLFYVRPGVEDRRGAFERDAVSLANIIRDFHEDMYPNMPLSRLEQMRDRTLDRLRAGVADPEGLGLIEQQYRHSVRHPIRSVFFGDLPRILLIQMSYQALEMSRVANGVDEVLEGNDLNFKVMALLPVFAAGGLLAWWGLLRYRANHKPIHMRMKLLWRSLYRVISFAGSGRQVLPPFMRGSPQHIVVGARLPEPSNLPKTRARARVAGDVHTEPPATGSNNHYNHLRHDGGKLDRRTAAATGAVGTATASMLTMPVYEGHAEVFDPAGCTEAGEDSNSLLAASMNSHDGVASARQLNNYEQGMVLLLSHVIRSLAAEYLRSYEYFHELVEDLNDLESVQSSRHQRLATLERMRTTHASLF